MKMFRLFAHCQICVCIIASLSVRCHTDIMNAGSRDNYAQPSFKFFAWLTWKLEFVADWDSFLFDFRSSRAKETQRRLQNVSNSLKTLKIINLIFLSIEYIHNLQAKIKIYRLHGDLKLRICLTYLLLRIHKDNWSFDRLVKSKNLSAQNNSFESYRDFVEESNGKLWSQLEP